MRGILAPPGTGTAALSGVDAEVASCCLAQPLVSPSARLKTSSEQMPAWFRIALARRSNLVTKDLIVFTLPPIHAGIGDLSFPGPRARFC
jgi:hypothetical protein